MAVVFRGVCERIEGIYSHACRYTCMRMSRYIKRHVYAEKGPIFQESQLLELQPAFALIIPRKICSYHKNNYKENKIKMRKSKQ